MAQSGGGPAQAQRYLLRRSRLGAAILVLVAASVMLLVSGVALVQYRAIDGKILYDSHEWTDLPPNPLQYVPQMFTPYHITRSGGEAFSLNLTIIYDWLPPGIVNFIHVDYHGWVIEMPPPDNKVDHGTAEFVYLGYTFHTGAVSYAVYDASGSPIETGYRNTTVTGSCTGYQCFEASGAGVNLVTARNVGQSQANATIYVGRTEVYWSKPSITAGATLAVSALFDLEIVAVLVAFLSRKPD
ncbi:MAG: hypothetical protein WED04_10790 [Promethearchaeati archaeon SRVP18_Atabeyarchaeia-1]